MKWEFLNVYMRAIRKVNFDELLARQAMREKNCVVYFGWVCDVIDGFWIDWLDLVTTYTLHSELQAIYISVLSLH
jgi:hypothetical protein